jgi:hypothetical protein
VRWRVGFGRARGGLLRRLAERCIALRALEYDLVVLRLWGTTGMLPTSVEGPAVLRVAGKDHEKDD